MADKTPFHEDFSRQEKVKVGSERSFGLVFAAVFTLVSLLPLWSAGAIRVWSLPIAAGFLGLALFAPKLLAPLNRLWFQFGLLLHKIVNPLVMGLVFFLTVTPMALVMRLLGKRPLTLRFDREAESYWIDRVPPGPDPKSMKQQF